MNNIIKFKYIIFILIIILLVSLINNYFKIAVVGNGPLTEQDIKEINKYNIIAVINTTKNGNKDIPIKATHYFLRQNIGVDNCSRGFWGWNKDKNEFEIKKESFNSVKNIILLCPTDKECNENINKIKEKCKNENKNINIISSGSEPWKESIFIFNKKKYKHSASPSSGILTINYMLDKYPLHNIHIYGMNSTIIGYHDLKSEKEMIIECRRCKLHKTRKDTYEPFTVK